ncbi:MAG: ArsR/SmtB family transcription factor [Rubrobacteraceae bacterium]|jgi:ArsR family transcriptional regulator
MREVEIAKALSSGTRARILNWLRDPAQNFESRVAGDLAEEGVCVNLIAAKAGISQPTASRHLSVLKEAGLVETARVAQRNYHRRDEAGIEEAKQILMEGF